MTHCDLQRSCRFAARCCERLLPWVLIVLSLAVCQFLDESHKGLLNGSMHCLLALNLLRVDVRYGVAPPIDVGWLLGRGSIQPGSRQWHLRTLLL
ncbi:hypothetical protein EJ03DRAFT_50813 [Teratosphaeria nubilosa]|uniref:Secreted protein n=1 Tax=Teratosphaeria nubilosa TaxID=161662 RepID=A0A6G1LFI5_9PEZI|nr:hypothetical protein EJ03DRAFT_50813 [Teratosphaeria nubilosa]